jgi:serine/threonine protein kinase
MPVLEEGQNFERYRIVRYLGSGVSGESYEAEDTVLLRKVTLKLIHPWGTLPDSARRQFFREMQGISILTHPYLASVLDYGELDSQLYVARRYLTIGSLLGSEGRLWFKPPFNIPNAIQYTHQLAQTLDYIHSHGCLHGVLTLSNILVLRGPNVENEPGYAPFLLADVGLANFVRRFGHPKITLLPITAAPEQLGKRVTTSSDQFALAVILYLWLTGRPPYLGSPEEVDHLKLTETITSPSALNPRITGEQEVILRRALSVYPEERFPSVLAFANALLATLTPPSAPVPPPELTTQPEVEPTPQTPSVPEPEAEPAASLKAEVEPVSTTEGMSHPVHLDEPASEPESEPSPSTEFVPLLLDEPTPEPESWPILPIKPSPEMEPVAEESFTLQPEVEATAQPEPAQTTEPEPTPDPAIKPKPQPEPIPHPAPDVPKVPQPQPALETPLPQPVLDVPQPLPTPEPVPQPTPEPAPDVPQPLPDPEPQPAPEPPIPQPRPDIPQALPEPTSSAQPGVPVEEEQAINSEPLQMENLQLALSARLIITSPYAEEPDNFLIDRDEITIGRAGDSHILLPNQDTLASRHHALLRHEGDRYIIYDQRSANGVFVNGQKLVGDTGYELADGDHISIGNHELIFRCSAQPAPVETADIS